MEPSKQPQPPTLIRMAYHRYLQNYARIPEMPPTVGDIITQFQSAEAAKIQKAFRRHNYLNIQQCINMLRDRNTAQHMTMRALRQCYYIILREEVVSEVRNLSEFLSPNYISYLNIHMADLNERGDYVALRAAKEMISNIIKNIVNTLDRDTIIETFQQGLNID